MRYMIAAMLLALVGTFALAQRGAIETEPAPDKQAEAEAETGIQFLRDSAEALRLAKEQNKKLFVVWGAEWCGPCKVLQARVWSQDSIAERVAKDFIPLYLDGDVNREEKRQFPVNAYPTIILADSDGTVLVTQRGNGGMLTPERWIAWIDLQIKGVDAVGDILKEVHEIEDVDTLIETAERLIALGRHEEAAELYARAEALLEKQLFNLKVDRAALMLQSNRDSEELRALMDEILPRMFETKDERTQPMVYRYTNLIARITHLDKQPLKAREYMLELIKAFPDHEYIRSFHNFAAMYAHLGGDDETALKEMRAMIKQDEENGVEDVFTDRARRFVQRVEAGERYR